MDNEHNPRDILKALKTRVKERQPFEWQVHIHMPVEDVLAMIQNRYNTEWTLKRKQQPYTVTANFETLDEARQYAYMARLAGRICTINNNWTGEVYDEK